MFFNIIKIWRTTGKSKFNGSKKPLKAQKSTVSNNVPRPHSHELNLEEEYSSHGLNLEEELNPMVTDPIFLNSTLLKPLGM